jgi:phage-related minor tail protein
MPADFISNDRNMKCCSKCRVVANAQSKKYRDNHAEKIKKKRDDHTEQSKKNRDDHAEQIKKNRDDHAEQISEYKKKYYEKNTEQIRKQQKIYYEKNTEQLRERQNKYYEDQKISNPLNTKFKYMIHGSIKADAKYNRLYDIHDYMDEDFLNYVWNDQDQHCYHCNCEMTLEFSTTTRNPTQISVQRLDNDLAHIKTNCVLSCFSCNVKRKELIR